jgi:hypothetical protein
VNRRRFQLRRVQCLCVVIFRASFPPSCRSLSSSFCRVRAYVFIIFCISCCHILYSVLHFAAVFLCGRIYDDRVRAARDISSPLFDQRIIFIIFVNILYVS